MLQFLHPLGGPHCDWLQARGIPSTDIMTTPYMNVCEMADPDGNVIADLRRSAEWYSRLMGIPVLEERLNGGPVYWFDLPGTHLILDSNINNRQNPDWHDRMLPRFMLPARNIDDCCLIRTAS